MSLPIVDPHAKFSCGGCARCCTQPYAILMERDKVETLQQHDFSSYPQLAGKTWFQENGDVGDRYVVLSKQEGTTRCLFLADNGLCIIHKELGPHAKPTPCQKFPYHVSGDPSGHRVSLDFGCPNVQEGKGQPLVEQRESIESSWVSPTNPVATGDAVPLTAEITIARADYTALMDDMESCFADTSVSIWSAFARALAMAARVEQWGDAESPADLELKVNPVAPFESPAAAPRIVRMLFAGNILRDVVPASVTLNLSLWGRIMLLPRLMTLVKLTGSYDSKLLETRLDIDQVISHAVRGMEEAANSLLLRYVRTRVWQRFLAGTRLSVVAGLHQHILDLNAVMFLARARAQHDTQSVITLANVAECLSLVEMNIANQPRLIRPPQPWVFHRHAGQSLAGERQPEAVDGADAGRPQSVPASLRTGDQRRQRVGRLSAVRSFHPTARD